MRAYASNACACNKKNDSYKTHGVLYVSKKKANKNLTNKKNVLYYIHQK